MRIFSLLLLVSLCVKAQQGPYQVRQDVPFTIDGRQLESALAGGLNAVQPYALDVNSDGKDDLVLWDRMGKCIKVFIKDQAGKYKFAPGFQNLFPSGISNWMLILDFNLDGKKDIFTSDPLGMRAYVNTTSPGGPLRFRRYHPGFPILTKGFAGNINLKVNENDLPAISDLDGDGDLDMVTANFTGNGFLEYHRNLSVERTGTTDSLQMERVTQTWGDIRECDCGSFVFGGDCPPSTGRASHAGAKFLATIDADGDGDQDLLYGEEECNRIFLLHNAGDKDNARMDFFSAYPEPEPVNLPLYPASWFTDLDDDGMDELIVSVNSSIRIAPETDFAKTIWRYSKSGDGWNLQQQDFLQSEMVDVGDYSFPAVFDIEGDGDQDLLLGSYGKGISLFINTGNRQDPAFMLAETDFLGLGAAGYLGIQPQFSDLNNDGRQDLAFLTAENDALSKRLWYFVNRSSSGFSSAGQQPVSTGHLVGLRENIRLWDVNGDSYPDILRFNQNGALDYLKNSGSNTFSLQVSSLAGLGLDISRSWASASVADLNGDNRADLLIGKPNGTLQAVYGFLGPEPVEEAKLIKNERDGASYDGRFGGEVFPVAIYLDGSRFPSIFLGNTLGGLILLTPSVDEPFPNEPVISIYPNPVGENELPFAVSDRTATVQVLDILGKPVTGERTLEPGLARPATDLNLPPGIYIARFRIGTRTRSIRFIRK